MRGVLQYSLWSNTAHAKISCDRHATSATGGREPRGTVLDALSILLLIAFVVVAGEAMRVKVREAYGA